MTDYTEKTPENTPVVKIEWEDFQSVENWNDDEDAETYGCVSVGWLLENTEKHYLLARDYSYDDERWSGLFAMPKLPPVVTVLVPGPNTGE